MSGVLNECRILIVEDDYLLADELQVNLARAGAIVIGPYGSVEHAIKGIGDELISMAHCWISTCATQWFSTLPTTLWRVNPAAVCNGL